MSATSSRAKKAPQKDVMNKRVPENPRYKHVKSTIDTGASLTKYLERTEEMKRNYRYRKDEIFRRIKATTFAQLVLQVHGIPQDEDPSFEQDDDRQENKAIDQQPGNGRLHDIPRLDLSQVSTANEEEDGAFTARSSLSDFVLGSGEIKQQEDVQLPASSASPYLILDVRDRDEYDRCHIMGAVSYPVAMLSRSFNCFTKEILSYRNKPGRIIIIYDEDERIAPNASTTFIQREVDNIFMLSGGLKVLSQKFPEGIITGPLPDSCRPPSMSTARHARSCPPTQATALPITHSSTFTPEDLDKLQDRLDDILLTESDSASRLSSRSTTSQSRVASSRSTTVASARTGAGSRMPSSARSTGSQPPWK